MGAIREVAAIAGASLAFGAIGGEAYYHSARAVAETPRQHNQNVGKCATQIRALGGEAVTLLECRQFSGSFVLHGEVFRVDLPGVPIDADRSVHGRAAEAVAFRAANHMTEADARHQKTVDQRNGGIGGGVLALLTALALGAGKLSGRKRPDSVAAGASQETAAVR